MDGNKSNIIKIVCLYQVIMHYRLPFYNRIAKDKDFDFTLIYGEGKKGTKLKNTNTDRADFKKIKLRDYRIPLPFTPKLLWNLIKNDPDIVFTEGSSSLINSSIAFLYAFLFKKKFIWWSLGTLKNTQKKGFRKLISLWENVIERKSDAIFTYSTQGFNYFKNRGVDENRIFVAINVFDTTMKSKEVNDVYIKGYVDKSFFNIGFIGTIQRTKNLELLIDVVLALNKKYKKEVFRLHIIGDGEYFDTILKYCKSYKEVFLYGRINNGASKILKNCDLMVLPGLGGLAIVEGMLNSLAIITGNADGTEYDLVDEKNGYILEEMTFVNLFDKIDYLYNNPLKVREMGEVSLKKITQDYSFDNYYDVFKKMVKYVKE